MFSKIVVELFIGDVWSDGRISLCQVITSTRNRYIMLDRGESIKDECERKPSLNAAGRCSSDQINRQGRLE